MALALLLTLMLAATAAPAGADAQTAAVPSIGETLKAVSGFPLRHEGSDDEKALLAWIDERLSAEGVPHTTFDFSQSDFEHSFSRCMRVDLAGGSRDTLVVAVPIDAPPDAPPGADGSVSIALALDLISHVRTTTPPLGLTVLFLGAEYGATDAYPMGSTLFLRDFRPDYRAAVVYLNLHAVPSRVLVRGGARGIVSPYWIMNRCVDALRAAGVPFRLKGEETQLFRLGATDERTMIEPWLKAGYPSVGIEGEYGPTSDAHDGQWLESFSAFLRGIVQGGSAAIPDDWDRHYLLVQVGDFSLIVKEEVYVEIFAAILAAGLLYSLVFRAGLKKYLRTLRRNLLAIIPMAGLAFLFLLAGTYAVQAVLDFHKFSDLWRYAPLEFLVLKVCVALFLNAVLYNFFRRLPFPRNGSFYSAAALFFLLVDIVVVAVFNISFSSYFLWAFVFIFFSALVRNRWAKALFVILAPLLGLLGLVTVFLSPALPFCRFILLSPVKGNLLVAGASIPFILAVLRLGLIFPGRGILRRRVREPLMAALFFLVAGLVTARLVTFSPFSTDNPQPVTATQTVTVDAGGRVSASTLAFESPAPMAPITLSDAGGTRAISPSAVAHEVKLDGVSSPVGVSLESYSFLNERNVTMRFDMPQSPRVFSLSLTSGSDFVLFDSSFPPLRVSPREYRILVGAFPPDPLSLQLTLPSGGSFRLTLVTEYDAPLVGVDLAPRTGVRFITRLRVVRDIEVRT